jgi:thiamine-phosphate pyrophosphorylase
VAWAAGADYLGVGAMYATSTKSGAVVVGPARIKKIKKSIDLPVVAIGGINRGNIGDVMRAGADAAAVISAVMGAADIEQATHLLVTLIEREKRG